MGVRGCRGIQGVLPLELGDNWLTIHTPLEIWPAITQVRKNLVRHIGAQPTDIAERPQAPFDFDRKIEIQKGFAVVLHCAKKWLRSAACCG